MFCYHQLIIAFSLDIFNFHKKNSQLGLIYFGLILIVMDKIIGKNKGYIKS